MAGLLERLAEVPDPRDPRGVRHALAVVLALAACAVLARATSLLAVGEWIADAPPQVLERLGVRPDPVLPRRLVPAETTVRRLLARAAERHDSDYCSPFTSSDCWGDAR
ncbi:transposase family protein [Streptomyces sp. NPDC093676]|uniref:transposase family protein n=1 Tax=Streptomyces sp. NPDC093676 TaxID=3366050 RepID=UPI003802ECB2